MKQFQYDIHRSDSQHDLDITDDINKTQNINVTGKQGGVVKIADKMNNLKMNIKRPLEHDHLI